MSKYDTVINNGQVHHLSVQINLYMAYSEKKLFWIN